MTPHYGVFVCCVLRVAASLENYDKKESMTFMPADTRSVNTLFFRFQRARPSATPAKETKRPGRPVRHRAAWRFLGRPSGPDTAFRLFSLSLGITEVATESPPFFFREIFTSASYNHTAGTSPAPFVTERPDMASGSLDGHAESVRPARSTFRAGTPRLFPDARPRRTRANAAGHAPEDYDLLGLLGEGGMGKVFKARQRGLDRIVALKMTKFEHAHRSAVRQWFFAEACLAGRLEHPGIVAVFDVGEFHSPAMGATRAFYAMRYIDGGSWAESFDQRPLADQLHIWRRVIEAVGRAHAAGIVHNDLKPANILLDRENEPWVGDWGLANRIGGAPLDANTGTGGYRSPEQTQGLGGNAPVGDVYSLGAILREILHRRPMRDGAGAGTVDSAWLADLEALADAATRDAPDQRPPTTTALLERLDHADGKRTARRHVNRAVALRTRADQSGSYEDYRSAEAEWTAALAADPAHSVASAALAETRLAHARRALAKRDYHLALTLAAPMATTNTEAASLCATVEEALARSRWRRRFVAAGGVILAVLLGGMYWNIRQTDERQASVEKRQADAEHQRQVAGERVVEAEAKLAELTANALPSDAELRERSRYATISSDLEYVQQGLQYWLFFAGASSPHYHERLQAFIRDDAESMRRLRVESGQPSSAKNTVYANYPSRMVARVTAFRAANPAWTGRFDSILLRWRQDWATGSDQPATLILTREFAEQMARKKADIRRDADELRRLAHEMETLAPGDAAIALQAEIIRVFLDRYTAASPPEAAAEAE